MFPIYDSCNFVILIVIQGRHLKMHKTVQQNVPLFLSLLVPQYPPPVLDMLFGDI